MSKIEKIFTFLNENEIDYRLESNFCVGYIFYFLDGSVYPRRYHDQRLGGEKESVYAETIDHIIDRVTSFELSKDWLLRIEEESFEKLFDAMENYLMENYKNYVPCTHITKQSP